MNNNNNNKIRKGSADEIETSAMENCLMLLSTKVAAAAAAVAAVSTAGDDEEKKYTCKTCGRKFNTFQALGGHRASHNKWKIVNGGGVEGDVVSLVKPKSHACFICGMEFPIGQALGGHMRRHRPLAAGSSDRSCITTITEFSVGNSGGSDDTGFKKEVTVAVNEKKRKYDDVVDGELEGGVLKKVSSENVCLDLGLSFSPWVAVNREDEKPGNKDYEIEEGEIVEEEEKEEEYDFLKLELRLPISGLLTYF